MHFLTPTFPEFSISVSCRLLEQYFVPNIRSNKTAATEHLKKPKRSSGCASPAGCILHTAHPPQEENLATKSEMVKVRPSSLAHRWLNPDGHLESYNWEILVWPRLPYCQVGKPTKNAKAYRIQTSTEENKLKNYQINI